MATHISGQAFARNAPHLRADHLDCAHERIGEQKGPAQGVPELCAGLRIGGYAAGIVVRRARDETRPHYMGELWPVRLFDLVGGSANSHFNVYRPLVASCIDVKRPCKIGYRGSRPRGAAHRDGQHLPVARVGQGMRRFFVVPLAGPELSTCTGRSSFLASGTSNVRWVLPAIRGTR